MEENDEDEDEDEVESCRLSCGVEPHPNIEWQNTHGQKIQSLHRCAAVQAYSIEEVGRMCASCMHLTHINKRQKERKRETKSVLKCHAERAEQSRTEQSRAEQSRAEQSRAESYLAQCEQRFSKLASCVHIREKRHTLRGQTETESQIG